MSEKHTADEVLALFEDLVRLVQVDPGRLGVIQAKHRTTGEEAFFLIVRGDEELGEGQYYAPLMKFVDALDILKNYAPRKVDGTYDDAGEEFETRIPPTNPEVPKEGPHAKVQDQPSTDEGDGDRGGGDRGGQP